MFIVFKNVKCKWGAMPRCVLPHCQWNNRREPVETSNEIHHRPIETANGVQCGIYTSWVWFLCFWKTFRVLCGEQRDRVSSSSIGFLARSRACDINSVYVIATRCSTQNPTKLVSVYTFHFFVYLMCFLLR